LDAGADPNAQDKRGNTPLHYIAHSAIGINEVNFLQTMQLLLDAGADPNTRNHISRNRDTPLLIAAERGNVAFVKKLLSSGADMFLASFNGRTPFDSSRMSCSRFKQDVMRCFLSAYSELLVSQHGNHALHHIVSRIKTRKKKIVSVEKRKCITTVVEEMELPIGTVTTDQAVFLLQSILTQSNQNALFTADSNGDLPIHVACRKGVGKDILDFLVESSPPALFAARSGSDGAYPVMLAAATGASLDALFRLMKGFPSAVRPAVEGRSQD